MERQFRVLMKVHPAKMHKPGTIRKFLWRLTVFPPDQGLLLLENKFPKQILKMHPGKLQNLGIARVKKSHPYHFKSAQLAWKAPLRKAL